MRISISENRNRDSRRGRRGSPSIGLREHGLLFDYDHHFLFATPIETESAVKAILELDYQASGGAVETNVVCDTDDPCGAFVAAQFVPLLQTIEGWAFVHNLEFLEMRQPDEWVEGELLGVPARAKWTP